jgi:hypothetical protein
MAGEMLEREKVSFEEGRSHEIKFIRAYGFKTVMAYTKSCSTHFGFARSLETWG